MRGWKRRRERVVEGEKRVWDLASRRVSVGRGEQNCGQKATNGMENTAQASGEGSYNRNGKFGGRHEARQRLQTGAVTTQPAGRKSQAGSWAAEGAGRCRRY